MRVGSVLLFGVSVPSSAVQPGGRVVELGETERC